MTITEDEINRLRARVLLLAARSKPKRDPRFGWKVLRAWLEWSAASPSTFGPVARWITASGAALDVIVDVEGVVIVKADDDDADAKAPPPTPPPSRAETKKAALKPKVEEVFEYYKERMRRPRTKLTPDRQRRIGALLSAGFEVETLKRAVDGALLSPFHCGENENGKEYLEISHVFKSPDVVEGFARSASGERSTSNDPIAKVVEAASKTTAAPDFGRRKLRVQP